MSHYTFLLIDRHTDEPDGCISTHLDHVEDFDHDAQTHDLLTVSPEHPVFREQRCWSAPRREVFGALWDRQLTRKPQAQIDAKDAERATRMQPLRKSVTEVLLDLINEERQANGKAALTMGDLTNREESR